VALVERTSGTGARPKLVLVSHRNLLARIARFQLLYDVTSADRCLNVMPLCYGHGLEAGLIAPLATGGSSILPSTVNKDVFLNCLRDLTPTWYTAGFTYHQAVLDWIQQQRKPPFHCLRFARSGSGPLVARVRAELERLLRIPVLDGYSTSETSFITSNKIGEERRPGAVGRVVDGLAVLSEDGSTLPAGKSGEVAVRCSSVFTGYENDPEANERVLRDGWFRTGDHGVIDADGYLILLGRLDEVINRGGDKISPREVDAVLQEHPAVSDARCFPVAHRTLGEELVAAVTLKFGHAVDEPDLKHFVARRLPSFKVPRHIIITNILPEDRNGKIPRKALAAHFKLSEGQRSRRARTSMQRVLLDLWCTVLERDDIGPDDNFFLSGGDSLKALNLLSLIEQKLQYRLPLTLLIEAPSVAELEARLERKTLGAIEDVIRIHSEGSRRPLFAVGGRYGHTLDLLPMLDALGVDQPCYAMQPPGLDWSNAGCSTIQEMASYYIGNESHSAARTLSIIWIELRRACRVRNGTPARS